MVTINNEILDVLKEYYKGEYYTYIENNIYPEYQADKGHNLQHICDVMNRAFELNKNLKLDLDLRILSAGIFYHDVGRKIDDETHEIVSAEIFMNDKMMKEFFTDKERMTIKEAIEDHRASLKGEPRNIYGKLISSADRNHNMEQPLRRTYQYRIKKNPNSSLEEKIRESFEVLKNKFGEDGYANKVYFDDGVYQKYLHDLRLLLNNYDLFRVEYLRVNQIDELEYYLKNINKDLIKYIETNIFPKYLPNDSAHNVDHIKEVIRRSFELKETLRLELNDDLVYAIAACHDLGKYINHETHEKIAAKIFIDDENFKQFFTDMERKIIKEAIEDHRSSFDSLPRNKYGELISSADRNTRIEVTFQRSFNVGKTRTPDMIYTDFLYYTFQRLGKRYGVENPENMFLIDNKYIYYLKEIRELLSDSEEFNKRYSEVNKIKQKDYRRTLSQLK